MSSDVANHLKTGLLRNTLSAQAGSQRQKIHNLLSFAFTTILIYNIPMNLESITQMAKGAEKPNSSELSQAELRAKLQSKLNSLEAPLNIGMKEYETALNDDTFEDQEGEPEGTGEARKIAMQKRLTVMVDRAEKMKDLLDSGEELSQGLVLAPENIKLQNQAFLKETFKTWYDEDRSKVEQVPVLVSPKDQDYSTLKDDIDSNKFGEYTLNPDTQNLDFENIPESKILIPDLTVFVGKSFSEVAKHLVDTYSSTHHIPGVEYWKWLIENPTKSPAKLKDGNYYFNFGSLVRSSDGDWYVPSAYWYGSDWGRYALRLVSTWSSRSRVVLLEI
jgi:hypothetical protein